MSTTPTTPFLAAASRLFALLRWLTLNTSACRIPTTVLYMNSSTSRAPGRVMALCALSLTDHDHDHDHVKHPHRILLRFDGVLHIHVSSMHQARSLASRIPEVHIAFPRMASLAQVAGASASALTHSLTHSLNQHRRIQGVVSHPWHLLISKHAKNRHD